MDEGKLEPPADYHALCGETVEVGSPSDGIAKRPDLEAHVLFDNPDDVGSFAGVGFAFFTATAVAR
jgi:hypothetical protein